MKKLLLILSALVVALAGGQVFASGGQEPGAETGKGDVNPAGVFPIVDEKITLNVFMGQDPLVTDYDDNYLTKRLEDLTNIHVDLQLTPAQQAGEKMNLILASGSDLPDVFMRNSGNSLVLKYGQEGVFLPLNQMIEEYGAETRNLIADMEKNGVDFLKIYTAPDGNIYGLPLVSVCTQCEPIWRAWVDNRWLDGLGLDMPTTIEEFKDLLVAFKTQDPNGNGKADEIPLMGASTGWGAKTEGFLMMPFVVYNPAGNRLTIDESTGVIEAAYTQEAWLQGLKFIKGLIDEELLDPVSLTQTSQELKIIGESEPPITGVFLASNFQWLTLKNDKFMNYQVIPPLKGVSTGVAQTFANKYQPAASMKFFISADAANPEAAFRWADVQYSRDISLNMRYGKEGEDWVAAEPGEQNPFGEPAVFKEISQWGSPTKNSWRSGALMYLTEGMALTERFFPVGNQARQFVWNTRPYWDAGVANSVPPLFMKPMEIDEYAELNNTLSTYVNESFARFVTGDLPFSEWDEFQAELKKIGVERFVEMNEAAYRRQYMD
jgi:putative aldouronate transport system substrate-binding protein